MGESPSTTYSIELDGDAPTITLRGSLPSFGEQTVLDLWTEAGFEAASPVTSCRVETVGDSGQQTVSVPASAKGKAEFKLTDESPDSEFIYVDSVSADGWVSQQQVYGIVTTPDITSTEYPEDDSSGGVGVPGTFTVTSPVKGIAGYTCSFDGGPATTVKAHGTDPLQLSWAPTQSGWNDLDVYATAKDGTELTANDYSFLVN
jgi:hypothetical protein